MSALFIAVYIICGVYMLLNFKRDIHMLQQNSYRISRYWRWLDGGNFFTAWRMIDVALLMLLLSTLLTPPLSAMITALVCVGKCWAITHAKHKKPLVFTKRVWRIYTVTGVLALAAWLPAVICWGTPGVMVDFYAGTSMALAILLLICTVSYLFVIAAVWCLKPVENHINRRYWLDARRILKSVPGLKVVGITGSYGKTSTKHYLHTILSEQFETLMTPGSFNTPMGVIRTVREMMKPYTEIFICEMGAKQKNDVKEICDLVDPDCGIITAVGPMHLETFGNIDTIRDTKFELADAIPASGFVAVNDDFAPSAAREVTNTECIRYAVANPENAQYRAENIQYSPDGTKFDVIFPDGKRAPFTTQLVGECNISNLLGAIIVALRMGMPVDKIQLGVSRIAQVEHRLNMKRTAGGITIIDDAFNSNPSGSKMALEVLGSFASSGKRIVVTPGMIELGEQQEELNRELGRNIARNADVAIIVNAYNRDAIVEGITAQGFPKDNIHIAADFNEAQRILQTLVSSGDTVLYENDLPDSFK